MTGYLPGAKKKRQDGKPGTPVSGKGKRKAGWSLREGKTALCHASVSFSPIHRVRKRDACVAMCRAGWRGACRPLYGKRTERSGCPACGWPCEGSGGKRAVSSADKGYDPCSHSKARIGNDND